MSDLDANEEAAPADPVMEEQVAVEAQQQGDVSVAPHSRSRLSGSWGVLVVALLALVLSSVGSNRIWFSGDELATISGSTRTVPEMWRMFGHIDLQQAVYYSLIHIWHSAIPVSEFSTRLPSALGVAIAAAGVVVLGKQISTPKTAFTAGLVFAVLPRVTFSGIDGRVYALTMAVAVWLTVFCVAAARRGRPWWWVVYSLCLILAILTSIHLILIIPAHAVVVRSYANNSRAFRNWTAAAAASVFAMVPFLFAVKLMFPGRWIPRFTWHTVRHVLLDQYFGTDFGWYVGNSALVALVAAIIVLVALVLGFRSGGRHLNAPLAIVVTWIVAPTLFLLLLTVVSPAYIPRYMSFTAPAFALLLGTCITVVARSWVRIGGVLAVFVIAVTPVYLAQRAIPFIRNNQDYGQVAQIIDNSATPGDCFLIEDTDKKRWPPLRSMVVARPEVYERLTDPGVLVSDNIFNWSKKPSQVAAKLAACPAVWVISDRDSTVPSHQQGPALSPGPLLGTTESFQVTSGLGFRVVEDWQLRSTQLTKLMR
ncbi:glycosyltransferase family 39 protein [Mycobacterium sp. RTGN5]|uniref:glycosyltransferase family 39 protein n=1 Tax=Mycobacterium sp. RTGN5 TaxID=3016522 RepID=UPI0029C910E7|nr:glycosyltransferase family 39 protein [Mycobacterium sp. RTGN5]